MDLTGELQEAVFACWMSDGKGPSGAWLLTTAQAGCSVDDGKEKARPIKMKKLDTWIHDLSSQNSYQFCPFSMDKSSLFS